MSRRVGSLFGEVGYRPGQEGVLWWLWAELGDMQAALPCPNHLVATSSCSMGLALLLRANDSVHLQISEACETHCPRPYQQGSSGVLASACLTGPGV